MKRQPTGNFDWLKKHLEIISNFATKIKDDRPTTDYGNYTALKLIAVHYTAEVFSNVARHANQRAKGFDGAVYVDLFAGTGLVKLTDTGDYVAGSGACALLNKHGFDYSVHVEIEKEKCTYLENRLAKIVNRNQFEIINGDSNQSIQKVIDIINKKYERPIVLVFVDPEGMEVKFSTLKALSDAFKTCDFLINVNALGVSRVAGKVEKGIDNVKKSLEDYLSEDANVILKELAEGGTPQDKYAEQVTQILGRQMGNTIPIHDSGKKIVYYLLGYTRLTSGGSGYIEAFSKLKERLEWADRNDVKNALDQMYKRTNSLEEFF